MEPWFNKLLKPYGISIEDGWIKMYQNIESSYPLWPPSWFSTNMKWFYVLERILNCYLAKTVYMTDKMLDDLPLICGKFWLSYIPDLKMGSEYTSHCIDEGYKYIVHQGSGCAYAANATIASPRCSENLTIFNEIMNEIAEDLGLDIIFEASMARRSSLSLKYDVDAWGDDEYQSSESASDDESCDQVIGESCEKHEMSD